MYHKIFKNDPMSCALVPKEEEGKIKALLLPAPSFKFANLQTILVSKCNLNVSRTDKVCEATGMNKFDS